MGAGRGGAGLLGSSSKVRFLNNSSVAVPKVAFLGESFRLTDMSMRSVLFASLLNSASKVDKKGLRDRGLLPELERFWLTGEANPGEAALLRKGLLEERLRARPGDGRRSGIDGSANMMLPLVETLYLRPIKQWSHGR